MSVKMQWLNSTSYPNSNMKLSKVGSAIVVHKDLGTVATTYKKNADLVVNDFNNLSDKLKNHVKSNSKSYDAEKIDKLEKLYKQLAKQATYMKDRVNSLNKKMNNDTASLQKKAQADAWKQILEALLKDDSLSEATKAAIREAMSGATNV